MVKGLIELVLGPSVLDIERANRTGLTAPISDGPSAGRSADRDEESGSCRAVVRAAAAAVTCRPVDRLGGSRFALRGYSAHVVVRFANGAYISNGGGKSPPGAVTDAVRAITHPGLDGVLVVPVVFSLGAGPAAGGSPTAGR